MPEMWTDVEQFTGLLRLKQLTDLLRFIYSESDRNQW